MILCDSVSWGMNFNNVSLWNNKIYFVVNKILIKSPVLFVGIKIKK